MNRLAEQPLSAEQQAEHKRIRAKAEEQVRKAIEAGERERSWIEEHLDKPRLSNATPIEELIVEAERQWETIREYRDPMAIRLLLDEHSLLERMEDRRGPALREAESRTTGAYLVGLIDDFVCRLHKAFLNEAIRDWEDLPAGVAPDQWEDRPQQEPLGIEPSDFFDAVTRLKGHAGTPAANDPRGMWDEHAFSISVNQEKRLVRRSGFDTQVSLCTSPVCWHILSVVLSSAPSRASLENMLCDYPGEDNDQARASATQDLNKRLRPLKIRVLNRTLKTLDNP